MTNRWGKGFCFCLLSIVASVSMGQTLDKGSDKKGVSSMSTNHFLVDISTLFTKKGRLAKELYNAVDRAASGYEPEWVQVVLDKGADANFCIGECGWWDGNPLLVLVETVNITKNDKTNCPVDVQVFNMLTKAGADVNKLPYVWYRVYEYNNSIIKTIERADRGNGFSQQEIEKDIQDCIGDSNRLIEAFIEAGADPDMRGDPYPFSAEVMYKMTDEIAKSYFAKGSRPINIAIEKGSVWESQIDLLLKYVVLDEESVRAAERSKDPKMVEKINTLWHIQQNKMSVPPLHQANF
jgi:hypothetical protein